MPCNHTKIFSGRPTFQNPPAPPKFEWICRICREAGYQDQITSGHANPEDDDFVDRDVFDHLKPFARHPIVLNADHYTYQVAWSEEDSEFMGTCIEFPSLSWLDKNQDEAFKGIRRVVLDYIKDEAKGK
jgi:hypothetical protein